MFIQNLRASTADCHKQLELNNLSQALLSDNVNENIYCIYLARLYSFVKSFEQFVYKIIDGLLSNNNEKIYSI
jgi:heme oxygenase (biliverdin-IX-beta and delta-forming)